MYICNASVSCFVYLYLDWFGCCLPSTSLSSLSHLFFTSLISVETFFLRFLIRKLNLNISTELKVIYFFLLLLLFGWKRWRKNNLKRKCSETVAMTFQKRKQKISKKWEVRVCQALISDFYVKSQEEPCRRNDTVQFSIHFEHFFFLFSVYCCLKGTETQSTFLHIHRITNAAAINLTSFSSFSSWDVGRTAVY